MLKTMRYYSHHTKPLRTSVSKVIGGGCKSLNTSNLRKFEVSLFMFFVASFLCLSCQKEAFRYPEMQAYYAESCLLPVATGDSITRFAHKVDSFVADYPDAKADPLYPGIRENIQKVWFRFTVTVDTAWAGHIYVYY